MRRKKTSLLFVLIFFTVLNLKAQIFEDNFESYTAGQKLAEQAGVPWTTWNNDPGGAEDPVVSTNQSYNGTKSVYITNDDNSVLLLNDQISSRYKLSFYIYIEESRYCHYNLLHEFSGPSSLMAAQIYFDLNGNGHINAGKQNAAYFNFNYNEWILVENYIDLDNDLADIFIGSEYITSWQWTSGAVGDTGILQLAAVNFDSWNGSNGLAMYNLDNIVFESMPAGLSPENLTAEVNEQTITLNWDIPASETPDSYYVYRENILLSIVTETTFEETINYPGIYTYTVKAYYPDSGLSVPAGPIDAEIAGGNDRDKVLLEIGTGTWCGYCPGAAMGADDMVEEGLDVAVIEYHYADGYQNAESSYRINYYSIDGFPTSVFDGVDTYVGGNPSESIYEIYLTYYEPRIAKKSIFNLETEVTQSAKSYEFAVHVFTEQLWQYTSSDMRLMVALTESHIPEDWEEIMTEVNFVCRNIIPNAQGAEVMLENPGDTQNFEFIVTVSDNYVIENCELVIFMQDNGTKEVMNATKVNLGQVVGVAEKGDLYFHISPNPANDRVQIQAESILKNISIYNLSGQNIYQRALNGKTTELNVDFLNPGMYLIRLETESGILTDKLSVR